MDHTTKITFLSLVLQNKNVLFGKFSNTLTHEDKINKWKDLANELRALGIFNKDYKYLRDTVWQNLKRRTIEKRDNRLKTGSAGGKKCKYDDVDDIILEIIGKNSPSVEGLIATESSGSNESQVSIMHSRDNEMSEGNLNDSIVMQENLVFNHSSGEQDTTTRKRRRHTSITEEYDELLASKLKKMELEIALYTQKLEIAKKESYLKDLEIYKLEKELKIMAPSSHTLRFYQTVPLAINSIGILEEAMINSDVM